MVFGGNKNPSLETVAAICIFIVPLVYRVKRRIAKNVPRGKKVAWNLRYSNKGSGMPEQDNVSPRYDKAQHKHYAIVPVS